MPRCLILTRNPDSITFPCKYPHPRFCEFEISFFSGPMERCHPSPISRALCPAGEEEASAPAYDKGDPTLGPLNFFSLHVSKCVAPPPSPPSPLPAALSRGGALFTSALFVTQRQCHARPTFISVVPAKKAWLHLRNPLGVQHLWLSSMSSLATVIFHIHTWEYLHATSSSSLVSLGGF